MESGEGKILLGKMMKEGGCLENREGKIMLGKMMKEEGLAWRTGKAKSC
jgi:hypothetical protein